MEGSNTSPPSFVEERKAVMANVKELSRWMLQANRALVIKHKGIFETAIIAFAFILPEPTKENTLEPNSHILLDKWDKFFEYYTNSSKMNLFKAIRKVTVCIYEHDPHYRHLIDWWLEEVMESVISGEWKPRPSGHPSGYWNEPRIEGIGNYGLYRGRKFATLIQK